MLGFPKFEKINLSNLVLIVSCSFSNTRACMMASAMMVTSGPHYLPGTPRQVHEPLPGLPHASTVLWGAGFQHRQGPHLRRLWNLELGSACAPTAAALAPFSLRALYISSPLQGGASKLFASAPIAHMDGLLLLSLRGFTALDLGQVPSSVHTLQVGPARVVKGPSHR